MIGLLGQFRRVDMGDLVQGFDELRSKQTLHGDLNILMAVLHVMSNDDDNYDDPLSFNHEEAPAVKQLCQWWNDNSPENYKHAGYFRLWHWNPHDGLFYCIGDAEMPALTISEMSLTPSYSLFEGEDYDTMIVAVFYKSRVHNQLNNGYTEIHYADGQVAMNLGQEIKEVNDAWFCVYGLVDAARMYLYSDDEYQLSVPNADRVELHPTPWKLETGGENYRPVVLDHNNAIVLTGFNGSASNEVSDDVLQEIVTCVNACHRAPKTCDTQLTASGFNYTPNNIHELCTRIVKKAQSVFDDLTLVECYLWAYHHTGTPYLALDMSSGKDAYLSITMLPIGNYDLSNEEEPCLFDMVEALHVAGIVTQLLGIKNITIGNLNHETNREIPELPLKSH
jgi:hypothetical protein